MKACSIPTNKTSGMSSRHLASLSIRTVARHRARLDCPWVDPDVWLVWQVKHDMVIAHHIQGKLDIGPKLTLRKIAI